MDSVQFNFIYIASVTLKIVSRNPEPDPEQATVATVATGNNLGPGSFQGTILLLAGWVTPEQKGRSGRMEGYKEEKNTYLSDISDLRRCRTKTK